eukprot:COSAG02_NODE_11239_length_1764_cov_1.433634_1_plen_145_part_00
MDTGSFLYALCTAPPLMSIDYLQNLDDLPTKFADICVQQLNDQAEPGAQEGGRPEDGKHTDEWLVCEAVAGETTPEASRNADAAAAASAEQTARWKSALQGGDTATSASGASGASDGSEPEQTRSVKRPLEGAKERALAKLSKS